MILTGVARGMFRSVHFIHFVCAVAYATISISALQSSCKESDVIRYVSRNGTNTPACLNSSNPRANPCRSLNFALLEHDSESISSESTEHCRPRTVSNNLCIKLDDGVHQLTGYALVSNASNLTIEAVHHHRGVIRCRNFHRDRHQWDNLAIICSHGITVDGVVVENCGPRSAGIFFTLTEGIVIQNAIFRNNLARALKIRFCTDIKLRNCTFKNNVNNISIPRKRLGHKIVFNNHNRLLDNRAYSGGSINIASNSTLSVLVEDCRFFSNHVSSTSDGKRPAFYQFRGHGGGVYIWLKGIKNSRVVFRGTIFDSNSAQIDGGAVQVAMSIGTRNTSIIFDNCSFFNNVANETSGGALSVVLNNINATSSTKISIHDSVFENNSAVGGGAIGIVVYNTRPDGIQTFPNVSVQSSCFRNNHAVAEGSAIGMFSLLSSLSKGLVNGIQIENCSFEDNDIDGQTNLDLEKSVARAAVSSYQFPVHFMGRNRFSRNIGGGVSIVESQITVEEHSHLIFEDNSATFGGGLQLVGSCLFVVNPRVTVDFVRNKAKVLGGGIMANSLIPALFEFDNKYCFIRYVDPDVPPQKWNNISINFINNTATAGGAAIYGCDLGACSWLNLSTHDSMNAGMHTILSHGGNVSLPFLFSGNFLSDDNPEKIVTNNGTIGTDPVTINETFHTKSRIVHPGESFSVAIVNLDEFGNSRKGIINIDLLNSTVRYAISDTREKVSFNIPTYKTNSSHVGNKENITVTFSLSLYLREKSSLNFTLTAHSCHPGYLFNDGVCVCDTSDERVLSCDISHRYIYITEGAFGYQNGDGSFELVHGVPSALLKCNRKGNLRGCLYKFDDPDAQCANGRKGFLCGRCIDTKGVTLNLKSCESDCTQGMIVFIIWSSGVILCALIVLICNMELPAELRAIIFYVQVIGLIFSPYSARNGELEKFGTFLDLLTFGLPLPFCLANKLSAFSAALISFLAPMLALAIAILYVICAKFNSTISSRGAIHGLSLLSLFIYKYLSDASFMIVSCRVTNKAFNKFVFLYDGTQSCLSGEYLSFFVIAILIIFTVILPAPCVLCVLTARRWTKYDLYHFTDQITKDVQPKCGWYAGWDIGRRLMFIMIFFGGVYVDTSLRLLANFFAATFILLVHLLKKPFRKNHNNIIETVILLNLVITTASYLEPPAGTFHKVLVVALTILPYLFALGFLVMKVAKKIYSKYKTTIKSLLMTKIHFSHVASDLLPGQLELEEKLLLEENSACAHGEELYNSSSESQHTNCELKRRARAKILMSRENKSSSNTLNTSSFTASGEIQSDRDINLFEFSMD